MGRRYVRDNRGRFASAGAGATARGGRLRTAAGNKRATQTRKISAKPGNTVRKPKGLQPGAIKPKARRSAATSKLRPGELMNAVARPVNTMAKPGRQENPFGKKDRPMTRNVETGQQWLASKGHIAGTYREGTRKYRGQSIAKVQTSHGGMTWSADKGVERTTGVTQRILLNQTGKYWKNPQRESRRLRRDGWLSTSAPTGPMWHEIGHTRDPKLKKPYGWSGGMDVWHSHYGPKGKAKQGVARRVSKYAATNPAEFIAETYAGLKTGRRYDYQVMRAYREAMGLPPNPPARRRSRVRRKP